MIEAMCGTCGRFATAHTKKEAAECGLPPSMLYQMEAAPASDLNMRAAILREAETLINGDRAKAYGPPEVNFKRIAVGWSVILSADVDAEQVALCMAWLKIARLCEGPHRDSYVDGAAYLALAGELGLR